ncbi:MAG: NADH-quinone oxidoreductase subunit L, partial [Lachnospiraceae bacterium]|nr:NADH-quinone oxidoreductase subunit L [Candidatus Equihabitans merdae]
MIPFLICFPYLIALLTFVVKPHKVRAAIIYIGAAALMAASVAFAVWFFMQGGSPVTFFVETENIDHVILGAELVLMVFVTVLCFKYRKYWISLLMIIPTLTITWFELMGPGVEEMHHIYIDRLTVLMCLIIGIVGSLIAVYAAGYMHGYHTVHTEVQDRRNFFYAVMFVFLGSMFGFVMASNLLWIDFFWEVTSISSFLLIGYTKTPEAITNCFRALWMNLLGGTALAIGIVYFGLNYGTVDLQSLVAEGLSGDARALLPIGLIAFAALTKSAQMPFSTWLLGAMVAPTPSSALLHSATMVKAGIYVLFRLSPAMYGNNVGTFVAFVGGFTFLSASFMAIAHSDGKKVLAFSTISNLGLMVACAGMGTAETIWAGVFLMIFHAVSKSLLFQDIGAVENSIHSRDIEDMNGLLFRLPKLGIFMFIGIAGMFLAPFGMLIAKWSTLKASIDETNILMVLFICFGSATTAFYWTKWMGKLLNRSEMAPVHDITRNNEMVSLVIHT